MTFGQIIARLKRVLKYKFLYKISGLKSYKVNYGINIDNLMPRKIPFHFITESDSQPKGSLEALCDLSEANAIINNGFCFLNKKFILRNITQWNPEDIDDPLWKYYLNYFDYGVNLLKVYVFTKNESYLIKLKELINSWINNTKPGDGISWDPYPTSIRIVNWLIILNKLTDINHQDRDFLSRLSNSLVNQANFLLSNLEYDLNNNHLTSNAKALIWAGVLLDGVKGSGKWLDKGVKVINKRFDEEILEDGFQYEASTSYQILAIEDYLETYLLLDSNNVSSNFKIKKESLEKMVDALEAVLHPNGDMPLLNDSVLGYPFLCRELMAACAVYFDRPDFKFFSKDASLMYLVWLFGIKGLDDFMNIKSEAPSDLSKALKNAGYFTMRSGFSSEDTCLIFDCGPIGPQHCPGHGHADALSFELFAYGRQLIVDPGVYSYNSSKYRYFFKSTPSHNTIVIDDKDQSELIGSFRVGDSAKTELVTWNTSSEYDCVEGRHRGYKSLTHARKIEFFKPYDILISDRIEGEGVHKIEAVLILSNYLKEIKEVGPGNCVCNFGDVNLNVNFEHEGGKVTISDSCISREWNRLVYVKKITYTINAALPIDFTIKMSIEKKKK